MNEYPMDAFMLVWSRLGDDPEVKDAMRRIKDYYIMSGMELAAEAEGYHFADHGKKGGRPTAFDWERIAQIDAALPHRAKTERAVIIARRLAEEYPPEVIPKQHTIRQLLPTRPKIILPQNPKRPAKKRLKPRAPKGNRAAPKS